MALRIGVLLLLLPVLFVLQPALIMKGEPMLIAQSVATASVAVVCLAAAFEAYLWRLGRLHTGARLLIGVGGLLLFVPELRTDMVGLALVLSGVIWARMGRSAASMAAR